MVMNPAELREAGNWIVQLRTILGQGKKIDRDRGKRPESKHRTTKKSVKLLLSNLREGMGVKDYETTDKDIDMVVFNAVEQLIEDKVSESDKGRNRLEALAKFTKELERQFAAQSKKKGPLDKAWKRRIMEAVRALKKEEWLDLPVEKQKDILKSAGSQESQQLRQEMLKSVEGRQALGKMLCSIDPDELATFDFDGVFGDRKHDVLAEALVSSLPDTEQDKNAKLNPELFKALAGNVPNDVWNDKTARPGARKGLGPRVLAALWEAGNYDEVCDLIKSGVDTTLAANVGVKVRGPGIYSGFIQPIQHVIQKHLHDIDKLTKEDTSTWDPVRKAQAEGAQKIFDALEEVDKAGTLTNWKDVEESDMIKEFKKNPGTIWGFENIRMPYVESAHGTEHGDQPLRMMEIWKAVEKSLDNNGYAELLENPETAAEKFTEYGLKVTNIPEGVDKVEFRKNFQRDAKAFLLEFATHMPKGTFIRPTYDEEGKLRKDPLSQVSGVVQGKFMGGLACKAGLWWAKKEKKPVYYCLDGINMDDVTNYKKVKNKAIQKFLDGGGTGHEEVITLVELREILKNWDGPDGLNDTVKFVLKGEILTGNDLKKQVKIWQRKMEKANEKAGRSPAPDFNMFANELNKIDPTLLAKLRNEPDAKKANMDARDIVKKYGFLIKVANTRPHIVANYIVDRCQVLVDYGLISEGLADSVRQVNEAEKNWLGVARGRVRNQISRCHEDFRTPLLTALL